MEMKKLYKKVSLKIGIAASLFISIGIISPIIAVCLLFPEIPYLIPAAIIAAFALSLLMIPRLLKSITYNFSIGIILLSVLNMLILLFILVI